MDENFEKSKYNDDELFMGYQEIDDSEKEEIEEEGLDFDIIYENVENALNTPEISEFLKKVGITKEEVLYDLDTDEFFDPNEKDTESSYSKRYISVQIYKKLLNKYQNKMDQDRLEQEIASPKENNSTKEFMKEYIRCAEEGDFMGMFKATLKYNYIPIQLTDGGIVPMDMTPEEKAEFKKMVSQREGRLNKLLENQEFKDFEDIQNEVQEEKIEEHDDVEKDSNNELEENLEKEDLEEDLEEDSEKVEDEERDEKEEFSHDKDFYKSLVGINPRKTQQYSQIYPGNGTEYKVLVPKDKSANPKDVIEAARFFNQKNNDMVLSLNGVSLRVGDFSSNEEMMEMYENTLKENEKQSLKKDSKSKEDMKATVEDPKINPSSIDSIEDVKAVSKDENSMDELINKALRNKDIEGSKISFEEIKVGLQKSVDRTIEDPDKLEAFGEVLNLMVDQRAEELGRTNNRRSKEIEETEELEGTDPRETRRVDHSEGR